MKMPMPAKMEFAGENAYKICVNGGFKAWIGSRIETYQTDATGDGGRKRGQDVYSWAQPL